MSNNKHTIDSITHPHKTAFLNQYGSNAHVEQYIIETEHMLGANVWGEEFANAYDICIDFKLYVENYITPTE